MGGESWSTVRLGDIADDLTVGHVGSMANEYVAAGVPFLRSQNVEPFRIRLEDVKFITSEFHGKLAKSALHPGDVVIVRTGKPGIAAVIPSGFAHMNCSDLVIVRPGPQLDSHFLCYYINGVAQYHVDANIVGAVQQHFNVGAARELPLRLPPLEVQRAIARILGALDDKIELNRKMNATLEAMARALFKSWFVDFDPVRAKAEGRAPTGMDAATAKLFPSEFVDSELGPIPKGWQIDTIKGRASTIQYGLTQSATKQPVGPRFLRITDISSGSVNWPSVPFCRVSEEDRIKYSVKDGDILVARTGASTGCNFLAIAPPSAVFASYLVRFQFTSRGVARVVSEFMKTSAYATHVAGIMGGSAQPNASAQTLAGVSLVFSDENIAQAFFEQARSLDLLRATNERQSVELANIRDELLPRLLSGELSVDAALREVEPVA